MKKLVALAFVLLMSGRSGYAQTPEQWTKRIADIRLRVIAAGIDIHNNPPNEECGRFNIVKFFAWEYRAEGIKLLHKEPTQNGCNTPAGRFGVDAIVWNNQIYDITKGPNSDAWFNPVPGNTGNAREPFDPGPLAGGGVVDPPQPPVGDVEPRVAKLEAQIVALKAQVADLSARLQDVYDWNTRQDQQITGTLNNVAKIVEYLQSHPIPTECEATVIGIGLRCRLKSPSLLTSSPIPVPTDRADTNNKSR